MTEVKFEAEVKSMQITKGNLKITLEAPVTGTNLLTFPLIALCDKHLFFSVTDHQSTLPLEVK